MNNKATYDQVAVLPLKAHSPAVEGRGVWHDRFGENSYSHTQSSNYIELYAVLGTLPLDIGVGCGMY